MPPALRHVKSEMRRSPFFLAVLLAGARGGEARPLLGRASQLLDYVRRLGHAQVVKFQAGSGSSLQPPTLASATATSLSVVWSAAPGATSYALYTDSWWANDGKFSQAFKGAHWAVQGTQRREY